MGACEARSASRSIDSLPLWALISAWAASPRRWSRQTRTAVAPMLAKPNAVALPMPEVAPVIRQTLPCIVCIVAALGFPFQLQMGGHPAFRYGRGDQGKSAPRPRSGHFKQATLHAASTAATIPAIDQY